MTAPPSQADPSTGIERDRLLAYLDDLFQVSTAKDYGPNGLQVEGKATIRRLVTGVSACLELFQLARQRQADAVMVHHGIFWHGMPAPLTGLQYRRVRELMLGDLNLLAYHLPLDGHPELGNNVLAARDFGLQELATFAPHQGADIGYMGQFKEPISSRQLIERCTAIYGQEPLAFTHGPQEIRTLGIVSGGAQKDFYTAIDLGLDAFITGEVSEWVMNISREAGVHYLAAGHYATERCGIRRLGEHLAETFSLDVEFIDLPNPV